MQLDSPEDTKEKSWFPTLENPGDESEHTPIQQRFLRELRELQKLSPLQKRQPHRFPSQT